MNLRKLYLIANKITVIENLDNLMQLEVLELGSNRLKVNSIQKIENLDRLINLRELWLARNKISSIENLNSLQNLEILSLAVILIQANRLTHIQGVSRLTSLSQLLLNENRITSIENIDELVILNSGKSPDSRPIRQWNRSLAKSAESVSARRALGNLNSANFQQDRNICRAGVPSKASQPKDCLF